MQFTIIIWCALVSTPLVVEGGKEVFVINYIQDPTAPQPVKLTCSVGDWIHIKYIEYLPCRGQYSICENRNMSIDGLSATCVGRDRCSAMLTVPEDAGRVKVYYECIGVNQLSLCNTDISGTIFSAPNNQRSPGSFFDTGTVGHRCRCNVIGTNMSAIIYKLDFRQGGGEFSVTGDGAVVQPPRINNLFNSVLVHGVKSLEVLYYDGGGVEQYAWIRVEGTGKMTVTCSGEMITIRPASQSATTTPSSTAHTAGQSSTDTDSAATIGIVCGVLLFLIIVIAVLVLIIIKYVKRCRTSGPVKKTNTSRSPKTVPRQKCSTQSLPEQPRPGMPTPVQTRPRKPLPEQPRPGMPSPGQTRPGKPPSEQTPQGKPPPGPSEYESVGHDYLQLVNTTNAYSQLDGPREHEYTEVDMYETIHKPRQ